MLTGLHCIVFSCVFIYIPGCLSQTLLLATSGGVCSLEVETGILTTVLKQNVSALDFRIRQDELYFISENGMYYSYFSQYEEERPDPIKIYTTDQQLGYLALDWVKYNMYYSLGGVIYKGPLMGTSNTKIISMKADIRGIAIDPYERAIFLITANTIAFYKLPNINFYKIVHFTDYPTEIRSIAVDHYYKEVYLIREVNGEEGAQWDMLRSNYSMKDFELVLSGPQLKGSQAMDVFRREVVWANHNHTLYSCTFPNCTEDNVTTLWQSSEAVYGVRFFSRLAQSPNTSVACQAMYCSHFCEETSRYSIACSCPAGMVMHSNNHLCREPWSILDILHTGVEIFVVTGKSLARWISSLSPNLVIFVYICCGLMLALLFCGFCFLPCIPKPKKKMEDEEIYNMS